MADRLSRGQILTMWARGTSPPSRVRCKLGSGRARVFSPRVRTNRSAHAGRFVYSTGSTDPVYQTRRARTPERTGTPSCAFRNAKRALWNRSGFDGRKSGRPASPVGPGRGRSRHRLALLQGLGAAVCPGACARAPRRDIAAAMLIARWLAEAVSWRGAALVRGRRRSRRPASWRW